MAKKALNKKYQTGTQLAVSSGAQMKKAGTAQTVARRSMANSRYDAMLRDSTIKLAIDVLTAMLVRQPWSFEGEDPELNDSQEQMWRPYKDRIIRSALRGLMRDGWRCFELVFEVGEEMTYQLAGLKALKADKTKPLVYEDTGEFAGVETKNARGDDIVIDERHILFADFDEDGFGELPEPLLRGVEGPFVRWEKCDEGAQRYDEKVAGGLMKITYPVGNTPYSPNGGEETDNAIIAEDVAQSFKAAGYATIPVRVDTETGENVNGGWVVEHVTSGAGLQPSFITRLKYLDALKLRAFGFPERSMTEGTFGTKSEAEQHSDIAVLVNLARHELIIKAVNRVQEILNVANFDDKNICKVVAGKLDPSDRTLFSEIFKALMADPVFGDDIAQQVDIKALLDRLNVPTLDEAEIAANEREREAEQLEQEENQELNTEEENLDPTRQEELV